MNDKQRVELAIIPALMFSVYGYALRYGFMRNDPDGDVDVADRLLLLKGATSEAFVGLPDGKRLSLERRAWRIVQKMDAVLLNQSIGKGCMAMYYLIETLTASGKIEINEGSEFAIAMTSILDEVQSGFRIDKLDDSAQKAAGKMLEIAISDGYFA